MTTLRISLVRRLALLVAVAVPATMTAALASPHTAAAGTDTDAPRKVAGCQITVKVKNASSKSFFVDWEKSRVIVKGALTWAKLGNNSKDEVKPGANTTIVYDALFGCGANRRYKITTTRGQAESLRYFPSASGWTQDYSPTITITD